MRTFEKLDGRRRELGMSEAALAKAAGLSLPTVQRILSGRQPQAGYANILALAEILGMTVELKSVVDAEDLREQQAIKKAKRLVKMVQGTSALEGQAVDEKTYERMVRRSVHDLLSGAARKLWAE